MLLRTGQEVADQVKMNFFERRALKMVLKKTKGTDIEILLKNSGLVK